MKAPFRRNICLLGTIKTMYPIFARHCFRSISSLNQDLFAANKEYCINEKKAVKMIEDFKIKPSDYKERVDKVISLISTDVDCTRKGIEILQRLVNEVEYLKGVHIQ